MFRYGIPFTHTGALANIPLWDYVAVDLAVVNGWDTVADNNDGKSLLWGLKVAPIENFSMYFAGTFGAEQPDNGHSKRTTFTGNASWTVTDWLTLAFDSVYGTENQAEADIFDDGVRDVSWYGVAGYGLFSITEDLAFNLRAEWFEDPDGWRSLYRDPDFEPGVGAWAITPTLAYKLGDHVLTRVEYRHDEADKPFFGKDDTFQSGSDTLGA